MDTTGVQNGVSVLIETLWNVKRTSLFVLRILRSVLIETLWNVKFNSFICRILWVGVLIETLWNVKMHTSFSFSKSTSINRNIVECKVTSAGLSETMAKSINRNIVECKEISSQLLYLYFPVLIETLWNVKVEKLFYLARCFHRINRNIVECKGIQSEWNVDAECRINRNIVECKEGNERRCQKSSRVLIETLWNVKLLKKEGEKIRKIVLIETLWSVKDQEQFFT